jgi:predicted transcriptional regulator
MYRLEQKGAVKRVKKIGTAHIFQAALAKRSVYRRVIDDLLDLFGGSAAPVMSHLVQSGKLTLADLREAEKQLKRSKERR